MKQLFRLAIAAGLLLGAGAAFAANDTPAGTWKQVDDETGKPTSIIQITDTDGKLQGKVLQVMNESPDDIARDGSPPKCTQCSGTNKDQPIIGMTIMWGVSKDGDHWDGGRILDPKSGAGGWYRDIGGGMGAALNAAAAMQAYTLSDRGTWLSFGHKADLRIVLEGDPRLLNRYDVILLNPQTHPQAKQDPAHRFAAWLASPEGQAAIGGYMIAGQRLFHPESDPKP